jgi:hypothetical protein
MTAAAWCKHAPRFALGASREQQDRISIRECECNLAALREYRFSDYKPIALVYPGLSTYVADEKTAESLILQAEPIVVGPIRWTLAGTRVFPQVIASREGGVRRIDAPRALDVQSIVSDSALARGVRSDGAEVQDEHVSRSSNDGEAKTDQHIKSIRLHAQATKLLANGELYLRRACSEIKYVPASCCPRHARLIAIGARGL